MYLIRFDSLPSEILKSYQVGRTVVHEALTSTTLDSKIEAEFTHNATEIFVIDAKLM